MDDSESWSSAAAVHAELAAQQIARLKNPWWNPPWTDLVPAADSAPYPPPVSVSVEWGSRRKRSRSASGPSGIRSRRPKPWAAASSPATPLDFGSASASGCGSDEASSSPEKPPAMAMAMATEEEIGRRILEDDVSGSGSYVAKVGWLDHRGPLGFGISAAARDIRRSGKKKTMCELQEEEKLLLGEKIMLQKEVEYGRKAYDALQAENKRLKSQQSSLQLSERVPTMGASVVSSKSSPRNGFLLPDLNEPLSDNLD